MVADELREAINLIKAGKKIEARQILEPFIVANPQNIQAWVWEIETRESNLEKIKLMEACLLHNPDSAMIKKALAALKTREEFLAPREVNPFTTPIETVLPEVMTEKPETPEDSQEPVVKIACPFCGEMVEEKAGYCDYCGRELPAVEKNGEPEAAEEKPVTKKWYRRTWVKILAFIFVMPVWSVIELSDPDSRKIMKILAAILLVFYINIFCLVLYWLFTTNSSRANLLNWYQFLTDQSLATVPGGIIRVDGNVQTTGNVPFGLVELQARVYDQEGNLLGNNTRYLDASSIDPGAPARFQLDVSSLVSTLNAGLYNQQIVFYDDFSDPESGWQKSSAEEGETDYFEGQYRITVDNANFDLWANPGLKLVDGKIEVDAVKTAGEESNRFGIQCRYQDINNYYFAIISSDGYYGIGKVVEGVQTFLHESGMLVTDKINAGSVTNHLRFDCVGTRLSLYINGDYVDAVDDSDLAEGDVGLLAGTFEKEGTQVSFDNFVVANP